MPSKLRGSYNNKLDEYKKPNLSKTQKHCLEFIHAYQQDPQAEALDKTQLTAQAHGKSRKTIFDEVKDLQEKDLVKVLDQNKLTLTDKGKDKLGF